MSTGTHIRRKPTPNTLIRKLIKYKERQRLMFSELIGREPEAAPAYMRQIGAIQLRQADIEKFALILRTELSEKHGNVLKIRYGLNGGIGHTLKEAGKLLSKSGERIRVLETRAIMNLGMPHIFLKIVPILEEHGIKVLTEEQKALLRPFQS